MTDEQAMELALVENLQREDLDPVEEAAGIRELMTRCDLTQEQAARKLGKSRSALANSLRLLSLPETVLELLKSGFITIGHAKVVLGLPTPELQEEAAQMIAYNYNFIDQHIVFLHYYINSSTTIHCYFLVFHTNIAIKQDSVTGNIGNLIITIKSSNDSLLRSPLYRNCSTNNSHSRLVGNDTRNRNFVLRHRNNGKQQHHTCWHPLQVPQYLQIRW